MRPPLAAAVLMCVLAAPRTPLRAQAERYNGKKIAAVYLEPSDQPLARDQIGVSLNLRPGDVFDERELSAAIQRLYATGRYEDILVDAEQSPEGLVLTFRTKPAFFTSRVEVEGVPNPPSTAVLTSATKLDLGARLEEDDMIPQAAESLRAVLRANGFYNAVVRTETEHLEKTQEVFVRFLVDPGARARFARPSITGHPDRSDGRLIRETNWLRWWGLRGWKEVTERRVQEGLDHLRGSYLKRDHLLSEISLLGLNYDAQANTVRPQLRIEAGPKVVVKTEGAKVSKGTLRDLVPIYQERTVDRELLLEGQNHLLEYFQARGYFDAKVSFGVTQSLETGAQTIRYNIERGPRYKVASVTVEGNKYFDMQTVKERLSVIPARWPQYRRGRYSPSLVDRDRDAILDLYRSNGFRDVKVTAQTQAQAEGKRYKLNVTYRIEEGSQWFVSALDISGVDLRLLEDVQGLISSTPGQAFSVGAVAADRDNVLNHYFNNGYPDATFDAVLTPDEQPQRMKLRYVVNEGRRYFVRDVLINGLVTTRPELVTSRLAMTRGEPLSQSSIVETQRRLYDLGIFAKVAMAVQNPDGRERNKYVILQLDEGRRYSFNFGLGAEFGRIGGNTNSFDSPAGAAGFSPRMLVSLSRDNFLGLGHTASVTFRISSYQRRVLLNYLAPQFRGNEKVSLSFSSLYDNSRDIRTFTSTRYESAVQATQRWSRATTFQYRVIQRNVSIDRNTLKIDPSLIPVYSQPVNVTVFSGSIVNDRRDDPVDSTRGVYNTIDLGWAPESLSRKANYVRLSARNSSYYQLRRGVVLARTATFGWLDNLSPNPVPLPERFFAGGATTHRGFPENQAGPRDPITGFPIGGSAFLFVSTELRFPLVGSNLSGVLFHDMGNAFSSLDKISLRYRQRDREDFDYTVHAFGWGFRFKTPVGPIRLDLAYAPNSPRFVGFQGTQDELINGTGKYNVPQRVGPFQFHFSIGQTF